MSTPPTRTFDYRRRFDTRSLAFTVTDHFAMDKPLDSIIRKQWSSYLDQGHEGACTGFGTTKALILSPRHIAGLTDETARQVYYKARTFDEWPGEDYEGSSVLGAMQAAKDFQWISAYYWATTLEQMKHAVSYRGPLVIGINWYEGMFNPDLAGFLRPTGALVGGHAICVGGIDLNLQAFILYNSWGRAWGGIGGAPPSTAYLSFADAERLVIAEHGEAALMVKTRT